MEPITCCEGREIDTRGSPEESFSQLDSHQNIHYIPCSHSTLKRVIRSEFVVLLPWVKTGFEFGNGAIDIKRSFHLQGPRPAHVFHWGWVQTVSSRFFPAIKIIQPRENKPPIVHFISAKIVTENVACHSLQVLLELVLHRYHYENSKRQESQDLPPCGPHYTSGEATTTVWPAASKI